MNTCVSTFLILQNTDEEIAQIEKIVNEKIRENIPVVINANEQGRSDAKRRHGIVWRKIWRYSTGRIH